MISNRAVLSFLALVAASRGFSSQEEGFGFIEDLDQEIQHHLKGLQLLVQDSLEKLPEEHGYELRSAQVRVQRSTADILELAEEKKCTQDVKNQLANIGYTFEDRWTECMNLTEELVEIERIGFKVYLNLTTSWQPLVCKGANDLTLCFQETGYHQMTCISTVGSQLMDDVMGLKEVFEGFYEQLHKIYENALLEFRNCFGSQESYIRRKQEELIYEKCK